MIKTDTRAAFREVRTGERSRNELEERSGRWRVFQAAAEPHQKQHNRRSQGPSPRPETPPGAGPERGEGGTGPAGSGPPPEGNARLPWAPRSGGWLGALQRTRLARSVVKSVIQDNPGSTQNAHGAGFTSRGERPRLRGKRGDAANICGGFPQVNTETPSSGVAQRRKTKNNIEQPASLKLFQYQVAFFKRK